MRKQINEKGGEQMGYEIIQVPRCICERCGNKWVARSEARPMTCPKCRSPYWDRKRVNNYPMDKRSAVKQ